MSAASPVDPKAFRAATGLFVGNCSVITTGEGEAATGFLCTSVVAPTTDPPRLMAALGATSSSLGPLRGGAPFGWSSLGAAHEEVARRFAGFGGLSGPARYDGADWVSEANGARTLAGAALAMAGEVEELIDRDGFTILVGQVVSLRTDPAAGGLVWWQGAFRALPAP